MGNNCGTPISQMDVEPLVVEDKVGDRDIDPAMLEYVDLLANGFLTDKEMATMQLKMLTSGSPTDSSIQINRQLLKDIDAMKYLSFVLQRGSPCSKESALYCIRNLSLLPESHYGILTSDAMYRMILTLRRGKYLNQCRVIVDTLIQIAKNADVSSGLFSYHELLYSLEQYMKQEEEIIEVKRGVLLVNCMARLPGADQFVLQANFFPRIVDWHNNTTILTWPYNDSRTSLYIRASLAAAINDMLQGRQSKELLIALKSLDGAKMALEDIIDGIATKKGGVEADELTKNGLIMAKNLLSAGKDVQQAFLQPIMLQYVYRLLNRSRYPNNSRNEAALNGSIQSSKMADSGKSSDNTDDFKIEDQIIEEVQDSVDIVPQVDSLAEAQICACQLIQEFLEHGLDKDMMINWDIPKALMRCQKSNNSRLANAAFQALIAFGDNKLVDKLDKENIEEEEEEEDCPLPENKPNSNKQDQIDENDINSVMAQLKDGDVKIQAMFANNPVMIHQLVSMLKSDNQNQQKDMLQILSRILSRGIIKQRVVQPLMKEGIVDALGEIMQKNLYENKKDSFQYAAWSAYCLQALQNTDATTKAKVAATLKEDEGDVMGLVTELTSHSSKDFFD